MKPRNTLILLAVLAALGAYLYWVELPRQQSEAEQKRLVALDKEAVTALTLDYPDHSIALEKQDGTWHLTRPIEADADAMAVSNLITAIADAQVTRTLDDVGDKLASYGLDQPEATVTITLEDGTTMPPLKIGKTTQVGYSAYVQKGEDPKVYIAGAALQSGLKKQLKDVREKTIIAFDDAEVNRLQLDRRGDTVEISRAGDAWAITKPRRYPADAGEVRSLLSSLRSMRADDFVSDDPEANLAPYSLVNPKLRVILWTGKDDAQKVVNFGSALDDPQKKMVYVRRGERPTVYTVPEYAVKNVDKDLATLRDKTVLAFDKEKAAKIEVTRKDDGGFTLAKRDGAWHLDTPGEGSERTPTIVRFVDDLAGFKGSEIVNEVSPDLARYGLDAPDLKVAVSGADGASLGGLRATRAPAPPQGGEAKVYAAPAAGGIVYAGKPFVFDRIDKRASDLRELPATPRPSGMPTPLAAAPADTAGPDELDGAGDLGGDELDDEDFGDDE